METDNTTGTANTGDVETDNTTGTANTGDVETDNTTGTANTGDVETIPQELLTQGCGDRQYHWNC